MRDSQQSTQHVAVRDTEAETQQAIPEPRNGLEPMATSEAAAHGASAPAVAQEEPRCEAGTAGCELTREEAWGRAAEILALAAVRLAKSRLAEEDTAQQEDAGQGAEGEPALATG